MKVSGLAVPHILFSFSSLSPFLFPPCVHLFTLFSFSFPQLGTNPMTLTRAGSDEMEILNKDETYPLNEGDTFTLCGEMYRFVVHKSTATSTTASKKIEKEQVFWWGKKKKKKKNWGGIFIYHTKIRWTTCKVLCAS